MDHNQRKEMDLDAIVRTDMELDAIMGHYQDEPNTPFNTAAYIMAGILMEADLSYLSYSEEKPLKEYIDQLAKAYVDLHRPINWKACPKCSTD
ncbi:MAG: hypothetical protein HQL58_12560 [Magnetococcales bacterium]|nr:hypothetical protein [Magnetococcales bacterium]